MGPAPIVVTTFPIPIPSLASPPTPLHPYRYPHLSLNDPYHRRRRLLVSATIRRLPLVLVLLKRPRTVRLTLTTVTAIIISPPRAPNSVPIQAHQAHQVVPLRPFSHHHHPLLHRPHCLITTIPIQRPPVVVVRLQLQVHAQVLASVTFPPPPPPPPPLPRITQIQTRHLFTPHLPPLLPLFLFLHLPLLLLLPNLRI